MNKSQEQLLSLLSIAINGGIPAVECFSSVSEEELFNLALEQNIYCFLFPVLIKYHELLMFNEIIMRRWKDATLYTATRQASMMSGIITVLSLFESNGITAISIKGLVLKQLYPQPELRNMGDIDLLIDEKDMNKSIELLGEIGYHPDPKDMNNPKYMHISLQKPGSISVELHRTLWAMKTKPIDAQNWLNHIWSSKRLVEIDGQQFSALSIEDEFINLIVHMARHLIVTGARICQFCDFVLFIKTYWNVMDLEYINKIINSMNLFKFYTKLLANSCVYAGLTISIDRNNFRKNSSDLLMELIFTSTSHHHVDHRKYLINITLQKIPFIAKLVKLLKPLGTRHLSLSNIGLRVKY